LETFTTSGDKTTSFKVGKEISVTGSTGNDGIYRVASSSYAGGPDETTVTVTGDVVDATADGFLNLTCDYSRETGGAGFIVSNENTVVGDCACGTEVITTAGYGGTMTINSCAQTPFSGTFGDDLFPCDQCCPCWSPPCMTNGFEIRSAVAGVSGVGKFRIPSDKTDVFIAGYSFTVKGSASNDGTYSVLSSSFAGSTTTILTNEAIPATATDSDGFINEYEMETCYEIVGYSDGMFTGCGGTCAPVSDDLDGPWVGDVYSYTGMNGSPGPKTVHEARICEWRDSKDFGHTFDSAKRLNNVTLVNSVETPAGEPEVYIHKWTFTATCSGGTVWKGHLYSPTPGGIYTRDGFVPGCATGPTTVTLAGCGATDPGSICQCNHHPPTTLSDPTFDCGPLSDCYGISGYSSSFFTLCGSSSCDGTSVQCDANGGTTPEWDGNFDYPQSGCRWRHINGGVGGPISFPICVNGSRATLQLRLIPAQVGSVDSAGGPYWELSVRCVAAADVWTGRKIITASTPDTPAGVYTKNSGCDATGSVTLVACP
jgi:hypothetical protein